MDVLLTFTGHRDPYVRSLDGEIQRPGPILALLTERSFDKVFLFSTPGAAANTEELLPILHEQHVELACEVLELDLPDPTEYSEILTQLRTHLRQICLDHVGANFFISVASGTPQMHASWVMLVAGGEISARILHTRPPRFVTEERPAIAELDLSQPAFPDIRAPISAKYIPNVLPDLEEGLQALGIIGDHPSLREQLEIVAMIAPHSVPVLILGETGTGKELVARLVHKLSGRPAERFVPVNCAAIPAELAESTLFGHEKGAFTGAVKERPGFFERADGGTLFLDELGELPLPIQAKLLRVLQDGMVERVGASTLRKVDVRVVAATNKDLHEEIRAGRFREDLYQRLKTGQIQLPPLRERRRDIPRLALHILDRCNEQFAKSTRLTADAMERMQGGHWPGNVRDLENVISRAVLLARGKRIRADDLEMEDERIDAGSLDQLPEPHDGFSLDAFMERLRAQLYDRAMEIAGGNMSGAARLLGLTPQAVSQYLKKRKAEQERV